MSQGAQSNEENTTAERAVKANATNKKKEYHSARVGGRGADGGVAYADSLNECWRWYHSNSAAARKLKAECSTIGASRLPVLA